MIPSLPPALTLLALLACGCSGALESLELDDTPRPLLGGRYEVHVPGRAKPATRPNDTLVRTHTDASTLLTFRAEDEQMLFVASELFSLAGPSFEDSAYGVLEGLALHPDQNANMRTVSLGPDDVRAIAVELDPVPQRPAPQPVLILFVRHPDETLQMLSFQVDDEGAEHPDSARDLAWRIARSLELGDFTPPRDAFTAQIPTPHHRYTLEVDVAPDHALVATRSEGTPDDSAWVIRRMGTLELPISRIAIFIGVPRNYLHTEPHTRRGHVGSQPGALLGENVRWKNWQARSGHLVFEIIRPLDLPDNPELYMHIIITAFDPIILESLRSIAETFRMIELEETP